MKEQKQKWIKTHVNDRNVQPIKSTINWINLTQVYNAAKNMVG